jgi:regulator of protease activity HflC (stomatin/prohibitin superfamily)
MKTKMLFSAVTISALLFSSCAIVRPGEIGIRQRLGIIKGSQ